MSETNMPNHEALQVLPKEVEQKIEEVKASTSEESVASVVAPTTVDQTDQISSRLHSRRNIVGGILGLLGGAAVGGVAINSGNATAAVQPQREPASIEPPKAKVKAQQEEPPLKLAEVKAGYMRTFAPIAAVETRSTPIPSPTPEVIKPGSFEDLFSRAIRDESLSTISPKGKQVEVISVHESNSSFGIKFKDSLEQDALSLTGQNADGYPNADGLTGDLKSAFDVLVVYISSSKGTAPSDISLSGYSERQADGNMKPIGYYGRDKFRGIDGKIYAVAVYAPPENGVELNNQAFVNGMLFRLASEIKYTAILEPNQSVNNITEEQRQRLISQSSTYREILEPHT